MDRTARSIIETSPMSRPQILAVATTVALNALDGFDVLSISFASPLIAAEWGIDRAALGLVLSMELLGMAMGSLLLGSAADRFGRRPTILTCLAVMAGGMALAATARDLTSLCLWRVVTGLGIGGMLAAVNAVAAEFSNARRRALCVALMVIGYPLGAIVGGSIAAVLLEGGDWRSVFLVGAAAAVLLLPVVWFAIPESPLFLDARRPHGALAAINRSFNRWGHPPLQTLGNAAPGKPVAVGDLLRRGLVATTLLVTLAYFAHVITFYYILKWVPKIAVDMGFTPGAAAAALVWANVGGAIGGALFGLFARRIGLLPLTFVTLLGSAFTVALFGRGFDDLTSLALIVSLVGFFTNAGTVGLYATFVYAFPTALRASGTGFAIGIGRGGAALSPFVAGLLFNAGAGLQAVSLTMASGSLVALAALVMLSRLRPAAQSRLHSGELS